MLHKKKRPTRRLSWFLQHILARSAENAGKTDISYDASFILAFTAYPALQVSFVALTVNGGATAVAVAIIIMVAVDVGCR